MKNWFCMSYLSLCFCLLFGETIHARNNVVGTAMAKDPDEEMVFQDRFDDNKNGWPVISEANRKTSLGNGVFNGWYKYEQLAKKGSAVWLPVKIDTTRDFTIRCDTKWVSGDTDAGFGLIFCHKNWNYSSELIINANRGYKIYDTKNNDVGVLNWRKDNIINKKGVNALKVKRTGNLVEYFVNGRKVYQSAFRGFSGNNFGFVIFQPQVVLFDNLTISQSIEKAALPESLKPSHGNLTVYTPFTDLSKMQIQITPENGESKIAFLDGILGFVKNPLPVNDYSNMAGPVTKFKTGGDYYYSVNLPYGKYKITCSKYDSNARSYNFVVSQQEVVIDKESTVFSLNLEKTGP